METWKNLKQHSNLKTQGQQAAPSAVLRSFFSKGYSSDFKPVKIRISQQYQKKIFIPLYKKIISLILIQDFFRSIMGCCCSCCCWRVIVSLFFFFYSMLIIFKIWRQMCQSFTSSGSLVGQQQAGFKTKDIWHWNLHTYDFQICWLTNPIHIQSVVPGKMALWISKLTLFHEWVGYWIWGNLLLDEYTKYTKSKTHMIAELLSIFIQAVCRSA